MADVRTIPDKHSFAFALSLAELRKYPGSYANQPIRLAYGTSPGDGLEGDFYWSNQSTTADNGVSVVAVDNVTTGRWHRIYGSSAASAQVATIALLKALQPPTTANTAVSVLGYYSAGDGGGGEFYWDSASSATDNGGTVIAADAGGVGRWRALGDMSDIRRWGARVNGSTDDTAKINLATAAADSYSSSLYRAVTVPQGTSVVGGSNGTIYVRKGQKLGGLGVGSSVLDASGAISNTAAVVVLGKSSAGATDSGGQPVEVGDLCTLGGPSSYSVIDTSAVSGFRLHNLFVGSPGVGVTMGGTDGLLSDSLLEQGTNHVWVTGGNHLISDCLFYTGNYPITLKQGAYDVLVQGCQFEYFAYNAVLTDTSATGILNARVKDCNFLHNAQNNTSDGAVVCRATSGEMKVQDCEFRNLYSAGVRSVHSGTVLEVMGCTFDGNETLAGYTQSTTMQGVNIENGSHVLIKGSTFRNLPGQPITLAGTAACTLVVDGCTFSGNTGGTVEINITNNNPASAVYIIGCKDGGRALVNSQSTVPVFYINNTRALASATLTNQSAAIGTTTLYTVPSGAGGLYRLNYYLYITTTGNAVNLTGTFGWTDDSTGGGPVTTGNILCTNATNTTQTPGIGQVSSLAFHAAAGTNITYATALSGGIGAGRYALRMSLEYLPT